MNTNTDIVYKDESYAIMGACFNVYNDMGPGFLEAVYQECLEIELAFQQIHFVPQKKPELFYREQKLEHYYQPDFVCYDKIVLEIKAKEKLIDRDRCQVLNCLSATGFKLGILVNLGHYPKLEYERIVI